MMSNISTIEDILESLLGLVLGGVAGQHTLASPTGGQGGGGSPSSQINNAFRPASIGGGGFWLLAQRSTLNHNGDWAPEYNKEAVTFYRWQQKGVTKEIIRVTVWVGMTNRDNARGQTRNYNDPFSGDIVDAAANPVIALGRAWELIRNEIPQVIGPGSSLDPNSIAAAREILAGLASRSKTVSTGLTDDLARVNIRSADFRGSAESAWHQRVSNANRFMADIQDQFNRWDNDLKLVGEAIVNFTRTLITARDTWVNIAPAGHWHNPYRVIARMFNDSTLDFADIREGPTGQYSGAWDLSSQYADAHYQSKNRGDRNDDGEKPIVMWKPPAWLGASPINAFDTNAWNTIDRHLRTTWTNNLINSFSPVIPAAKAFVAVFANARETLYISDPAPIPPPPMPNNINGTGGSPYPNFGDPFANIGNLFANIGNPFANMGNPFANMGNQFGNGGINFNGLGNPFPNSGAGGGAFLAGGGSPFANSGGIGDPGGIPGGGAGGGFGSNPFANSPQFSSSFNPGGIDNLGDLTPTQLEKLASSGLLDDNQLTAAQLEFLRSNGLGVPAGSHPTLGQLTPQQRAALQQNGLLDQVPLTPQEREALGLPPLVKPLSPTSTVSTNPFPTTVDGVNVTPGGSTGGLGGNLGDVTVPGAVPVSTDPPILVGTGGLSGWPGLTGTPGALNPADFSAVYGNGAGSGASGAGGSADGGRGAAGAAGSSGSSGTGSGAPFMPFMPPMGGGPAGGQPNDREGRRSTWLKEDEEVWGTDPDCPPAVVGRRRSPNQPEEHDDFPANPTGRPGQDERRPYRRN